MTTDNFFDEQTEQSLIKTTLVSKYFWAWAKIIMPRAPSRRIAYIDLFAGPGRYRDGMPSTPLRILETAINDPRMREMLVAIFNDVDPANASELRQAINVLPGIDTLKYIPEVYNDAVGEDLTKMFEAMKLVPSLIFVDPFGYKGLSLRLIYSVLKDWGCDCLFFFNYRRINMAISNPYFVEHMHALFGKEGAEALQEEVQGLPPAKRELVVIESFCEALKSECGKFVLPFRFRNENGTRTQHHLIFVSKHVLGYTIMKGIMARASSVSEQGVASFEYNPSLQSQGFLFELNRPLADLEQMLLDQFAGQMLTREKVFQQHHVGTPFIEKNYREVLLQMERAGKIITDPPSDRRKANTMGKDVRVTFPVEI